LPANCLLIHLGRAKGNPTMSETMLIVLGASLIIAALLLRVQGKRTNVRIKKMNGNVNVGDGPVVQTYHASGSAPAADPAKITARDVITWLLTLLGVLIAGSGLYLEHFG